MEAKLPTYRVTDLADSFRFVKEGVPALPSVLLPLSPFEPTAHFEDIWHSHWPDVTSQQRINLF
jgi:hypothetical protein